MTKTGTIAATLCLIIAVVLTVPAQAKKTPAGKEKISAFEEEKPAGYLWYGANVKDMRNFDPHFATRPQSLVVAGMMFNRLLRYTPGDENRIEPDLAENIPAPEIVDGRQVWSFRLKKGVMFHPGPKTEAYELTADDVVYSLNKTIKMVNPSLSGDFSGMSVEKTGTRSIRIIMEKPRTPAVFIPKLAAYSGGFIICKKAFQMMGYDKFKKHPVGTGPFKFESRTPGQKATFSANENYFRGKPRVSGVEVFFISDLEERETGFAQGKLDIVEGEYTTGWIRKWRKQKNAVVDLSGVGEISMIHFNTLEKPFNDVNVRKAIAYALDRDAFARAFDNGVTENVHSPVPERLIQGGLSRDTADSLEIAYPTNRELSKKLLEEAGYPDGFSIELLTSEMPVYLNYYEGLREQLARVGIKCAINVGRHSAMHVRIRKGANPLVVYNSWRPDVNANLTRFFHSDSIMITGARPDANFSKYDEVDKLIEAARYEVDPEKQKKLWNYAQIKILDDMAAYPVHYLNPIHARRSYVNFGHKLTGSTLYPPISEKTKIE